MPDFEETKNSEEVQNIIEKLKNLKAEESDSDDERSLLSEEERKKQEEALKKNKETDRSR